MHAPFRASSIRQEQELQKSVCLCMREKSCARMRVTHNAYRSPRFSPGIPIFRFNRRITYLLGPCPGGPRHDGIDYANSRNRPSWLKPLRNYASTPSDWGLSISVPHISLSLRPFNPPLFLSPPLFALRVLPLSFFLNLYTLSHPSCPSLLFSECAVHRHSHSIASSILFPPPPLRPLAPQLIT